MRPPFRLLRERSSRRDNRVVMGRKFCVECGRWRHVCDFVHGREERIGPRCHVCTRLDWRRRSKAKRGISTPSVVLGRKFCSGCGRWRHVCDFTHDGERIGSRCYACVRLNRRARGSSRPTRTVDVGVLLAELEDHRLRQRANGHPDYSWADLARDSGITDRTLRRYRTGEITHVSIVRADEACVGIGTAFGSLYPLD